VAIGEQRDEQVFDDVFLTDDGLGNVFWSWMTVS